MKRTITVLVFILTMVFSLAFTSNAGESDEIIIYNKDGRQVQTYSIEKNDIFSNAREAIQPALDYCRDNATAKNIHTVSIPEGTYYFDSSLNIYSNTTLELNSSLFIRNDGCGSFMRFGRSAEEIYGYHYKNITIKNGTLNAMDNGTSSLVRFAHAYNVVLSDLTFRNTTGVQHLLTFAACKKVRVNGCEFLDMRLTSKKDVYNCEALQIDILKDGHFTYPAYDETVTSDVIVSDCLFESVPRGIGTHSGVTGHYFTGIKINNNTFRDIEGYAIKAVNYRKSSLNNNLIEDCGSGIYCGSVTGAALKHYYPPYSKDDAPVRKLNVTVSNNKISLTSKGDEDGAYGIYIMGKDIVNKKSGSTRFSADCRIGGVTVSDNKITSDIDENIFYGIHIEGALGSAFGKKSDVKILNNSVLITNKKKASNTIYGMKIEDSEKVYAKGNTFSDKKAKSMSLKAGLIAEDSKNIYISLAEVKNTREYGIKIETVDRATLYKSSVENAGDNGIYVKSDSDRVLLKSNKVNKCTGYGIAVNSSNATDIVSCTVISSGKSGIYVTTDATVDSISSCYVCKSGNHAIYLNKNAYVGKINKNYVDITSGSTDAIALNDTSRVKSITSNQINTKKKKQGKSLKVKCKHGIRINSSALKSATISKNTINSCANSGIYISKAKSKIKVTSNKISSCKYGVAYLKGKASLKKNTVKKYSSAKTRVM